MREYQLLEGTDVQLFDIDMMDRIAHFSRLCPANVPAVGLATVLVVVRCPLVNNCVCFSVNHDFCIDGSIGTSHQAGEEFSESVFHHA